MTAPARTDSAPATRPLRLVGAALAAGITTDLAGQAGAPGVATTLLVAVFAGGLMWCARLAPQALAVAGAAALFGFWMSFRASAWLIVPDLAVVSGLLLLAVVLARGGDLFDLSPLRTVGRSLASLFECLLGPALLADFARGALRRTRRSTHAETGWAVARGVALAIPVLAVLGALLASADAVFATLFQLDVDAVDATVHVLLVALGASALVGLVGAAVSPSSGPDSVSGDIPRRLGAVEALVVVCALDALFAAFAIAQLVALSEGGRRVIETAGLTYAEYARSGFFQLLAVACITLVVLAAVRATVSVDRRWQRAFTVAAEVAVGLTLVIVIVAVRRLLLYEEAFGLTMLRLHSTAFAVWIGAVFALLGAAVAGVRRDRRWLTGASLSTGLAVLLVLNVANPEAIVVESNLAHYRETGELDAAYLANLSADAVPSILDAVPELPGEVSADLLGLVCARHHARPVGWPAWNVSKARAEERVRHACPLN